GGLRRGRRRASGGLRGRVLAGVAAAAVAVAVASGVVAFDARRDLGEVRGRQGDVLAVLAAPDAETVRRPIASGGTGTVVVSRAGGRLVFTSSGLPELPEASGYELWLMGPDGARAAGMLERVDGGLTEPVVTAPRRGEEQVALTIEPASGSERPTTDAILLADLPGT
ncbi:MAG: anti-sigma factor, partial [Nonomuraea sp.]|nr:anti-sigma factor [Nonomuraea sp.]